jgi:uncharacterized phage protein gp47/JayE
MAVIKKSNGREIIDYMARDYDSLLKSMRDLVPNKLPEWADYKSEADFGNVLLQLFAHMGDTLSYYQDRIANESFLGTARNRRSIIHHLRLIGYKLSTAAPASASLNIEAEVPETYSDVVIRKGDAFATKSQKDKPSVRFEYTRETNFTIDCSALPVINGKKRVKGTFPVEEGRMVKDEVLGTSDGTANQRFTLAHSRLILRSLGDGQEINKDIILLSELGGVIDEWRLQESLAFSRGGQKDYIIEIDEEDRAKVIFGDGAFGAIPSNGAVVKVTYRVGGGLKGNVPGKSIETIIDAPQLSLLGAKVTNLASATGGAERESIDHAVMHSPNVFRSLRRAMTKEDYEALALDFKGVGKVRAEKANWNTVNLFIAPEGGGVVSDILRANLLAYFEDKRPLSTIIEIKDADYVKIYISAEVGVESYYSKEEIKEKVYQAVSNLLAFDKVDFNHFIYLSKFYEAIEAINGVEYVTIKQFSRNSEEKNEIEKDGLIALGVNQIPRIANDPNDDQNYANGIYISSLKGGV